MPARARTIAFVASCLNEEGNVAELYRRCLAAFETFRAQQEWPEGWAFRMTLADNGSTDGTADALLEIADRDPRVQVLINARNYGPEPSVVNAFSHTQADVMVLLASDLQDPPELATTMLQQLEEDQPTADAVLACKRSQSKGPLIGLGRWLYYRLLAFGTRTQRPPRGFHGFGVYRSEVLSDAVELWRQTPMSLRQALARSAHAPRTHLYDLSARCHGKSSYRLLSYVHDGVEDVFSGEALTTRLTMRLGIGALLAALLLGVAVIANVARGTSGYAAGTPTLMLLVLASLGIQSLLLSMLAFQIENLHVAIKRPMVRAKRIKGNDDDEK